VVHSPNKRNNLRLGTAAASTTTLRRR
jgi:hypothetical protein